MASSYGKLPPFLKEKGNERFFKLGKDGNVVEKRSITAKEIEFLK